MSTSPCPDFSFCVNGNPIPKGRPRLGYRRRVFTPKRTLDYEELVAREAVSQGVKRVSDTLRVEIDFYRSTRHRVDLDNLIKSILDALNFIAYDDDVQIVQLEARKDYDKKHPRAEVRIYKIQ